MFPAKDPSDLAIETDFPHQVIDTPTEWIEMSDGVRLAARIWRPESSDASPVPAVLEMIPYRRRDGTLTVDEAMHPWFAGHGLACLRVDLRGAGDSQGLLEDEYLVREQDDAMEIIAWIAAQPWCNGNVGMMGLSWGGFNSLQVAARRPPALKAIIAVGATVDRFNDDIHYKQGCLLNENLGWATGLFAFTTRPPDPDVVGEAWRDMWRARLDGLRFFGEPWFEHQTRDAYWKHGSVSEDYEAIAAPVMIVAGWGDLYVNAVQRLMENLKVPRRAIAGPWAHQYPHLATPGPGLDFLREALAWWRRWLTATPDRAGADVSCLAYLQEGSSPDPDAMTRPGRWLETTVWPPTPADSLVLHLGDTGLSNNAVTPSRVAFRSPADLGVAAGEWIPHCSGPEMPRDQRDDDAASLVFDTEPLDAPVDLWGDVILELTLSADRPTGNLIARLCDVGPDGASERVTLGALSLTHRNGNEAPQPMTVGERVTIVLRLDHVAHRFPPGHRIRLALSTAYWPWIVPAPDDPALTIEPDDARLVLPLVGEGGDTKEVSPAGPVVPPPSQVRILREPDATRRVVHDQVTGATRFEIADDYGETEYLGNGMINGAVKREVYSVLPENPLSSRASLHWTQELRRGSWSVRTETRAELTIDPGHYYLTAGVTAFEGEEEVFQRDWKCKISRL